ncbi:LOW QUALITY PROTEIN: breast cancer type 2 susceptibility protein [Leucoraja erinacea]|uniref:LOW QUALITY PROTEIN: breast cancer type 2 susceptibility protein n=1 Tax=Leucoraja erinaceus TaxID=7782 RepID=UPI0024576E66|nr:LOW QUALITY PROTEIN: breast cancer type 2 susceptibility protein [Leucoraja erinacea]
MKEQNSNQVMLDFTVLCQEDLGPLCQNWFEELTLSACSSQFKQHGGDVHSATPGYNNDYFKTPWQKQTLHSQLDCTPSIFSGFPLITPSVCTPNHRNEQSRMITEKRFSALVQGTVPPCKGNHHKTPNPVLDVSLMKSPAILKSACRTPQLIQAIQDDGGSFLSPPVSTKVISEQILESLGAEVDPDMSWTSSLATPPSLTPTVIICKAKEIDFHQDKAKEIQVPQLLHSNLNIQHDAFAFGQRTLPVIGEAENEEIEGVHQSYKPEDGPHNLVNESRNYRDGKQTVPNEVVPFTECTSLELRGAKPNDVKTKNKVEVNNLKIDGVKSLPSKTSEYYISQSIAADSDIHIVSNTLAVNSGKDCNMKGVFLNSDMSVDQNVYDRSSEELSNCNISSLSDWSQLNLSELNESQMINRGFHNVDPSTNALCLSNTGNTVFVSNENVGHQQLENMLGKDLNKGSSCISSEEISSVACSEPCSSACKVTENQFNYCKVAEDFKTIDKSINNSKSEAKSSSPNCTCDRFPLLKLADVEIPCRNCLLISDSLQMHLSAERKIGSDSENVALGSFASRKMERKQAEVDDLASEIRKIKPLATLKDHKASLTDSVNDDDKSNQPIASRSTSLVLDSTKVQGAGEEHSFLLSTLKGHSRKFLYSVQDSLKLHDKKNTSLGTDLQTIPEVLPLASKFSCTSPAKTSENHQKSGSVTCGKNEDSAPLESVSCIDIGVEASDKCNIEANESLQDGHQLFEKYGKVQDIALLQHLKDETVDKLSCPFNNDRSWDNFVTPLHRRHSHNNKKRRIFATARRTVAKRLTMESKTVPTNSVDVQTVGTEESCAPAVNSVQPEKTNISESTLTQNTGRSFGLTSLTDANQSPVQHNGSETKCEDHTHYLRQHDSTCTAQVSTQLSTSVVACTSLVIQAVSSHSSCVSHVLHKTEQLCLNSENTKRTLKTKSSLSELQQKKTNIEILSICSSSGKRLEESLTTKKGLSNTDQISGLHNLSGDEKRIFSDNTNIHNHNRKIAVLASTLKARKLKPDIVSDAFLVFSTVLPEYEIEYKENACTTVERTPCDLPSSISSGHEMTGAKSKLTENLHTETRADHSASETKTELFELSEVIQPSHNIEPYKGEITDKIELEYENPGVELSSVMINETCTVLENTKNLISEVSESYKCGPCGGDFKSTELRIDLLTQTSQEKLLQKCEDNSGANSAQAHEFVISKNIFENQKGNCPVFSTEAEIKTKYSEPQISTEIDKQPSACFAKTHTFDTSETEFEKKSLSQYTSLTASQTEDVNKLFRILEDTNSQFEFTPFGKQPAASEVNKDNDLLNKQLYCTLPSAVSDKWQDVNFDARFDVESSMMLNSNPRNLQQLAELSKMQTNSAIYLQNAIEVDQTTPNEPISSLGFRNKNKGIAAFTVPNLCTDSTVLASNTVKMHTDTMHNKVIPPLKDAVSFCTASGSKIKLSDESLQRAKNIFKDIGNDIDQISDHALSMNALSYSVIGSKKISEPKLSDTEILKSSESYLLHPAHFNLNSKTNLDNVLQNERTIVYNDRKDETSAVTISEEGKAMYLSSKQDVQQSDSVDVVQLDTMTTRADKNNLYNSDCSSTKHDGKVEYGSRMEVSDDDLLSTTFVSLTKSSEEAINAKGSNDTTCFHIASGKDITVSKKDLNVAAGFRQTKDSYTENLKDTGTARSTSQQLDTQMNNYESCIAFRNKEVIAINSSLGAIETGIKGFQTANGKMVTVCKASLDKATALFAEKDLSNETKHNISSESLESNISNTLIQKAIKNGKMKHLKKNHSHVNSKNNSRMHDSSIQSRSEFEELNTGIEMKSFQMASGKQISVSNMALDKGRALFFDDDYNGFSFQPSLISPETLKNAPCEDSTLNYNALVANPPCRLETINQDSCLPSKQYLAHCAANGSSINVSEANLKYTEEKFTEDKPGESNVSVLNPSFDNNQGNYADGVTVTELPKHFLNTGPIAFSTASGKPVQVSEESLKKCKQMFSDVVSEEASEMIIDKDVKSKEKRHSEKKRQLDSSISKASLGFNTASGKPVLVSDDALQKVKCMLKEFESSPKCTKTTPFEKAQPLQLLPTSSLFSDTPMGGEQNEEGSELIHRRKSGNSTESISNVQNLVLVESSKRKINEFASNRPKINSSASCSNTCILMSGFQTATGKEVTVEESSLTMARVQLASNKTDKLDHSTEKSNILTEARIKSNCNVSHASVPIAHALKNNYITNPEISEKNLEKWTMKDSKATMDHDEGFDYKPNKALRCSHAFTDQTIGPDLRTGKRPSSEVKFTTGEPPSKRRLLSEFDRTLQSDHKSTFKPLKCNPEGPFCDRRKFMYNIPLKPVTSAPSKDKSLSSSTHQQMISPNVTIPVHENSVRQDLYHHDIKQTKRQVAVFKPPFHSDSGGHRQLKKSRQSTPKSGKTFLPPFKTGPNYNQMEKQLNTEAVISPVQTESEYSTEANNRSGPIKDGCPLKGDTIAASEDKIQSISGTSDECKASDEEFSRIVQTWHFARNLQEMRLMKKKKQTIHPQPGSLYRSKNCTSKLSLHTAVEGKAPRYFTEEKLYSYGVSRSTLCVQAENAESFQINIQEFFSEELLNASNGLPLADGGCLIPDDNGMAGKSEFYRALLDTPGVDSSLIDEVWAYNHYRWLVWKLAAMEVAFPKQFGGRCLTPERILLQLKYRYDVEIDQSRRSALKRIMERDDVAAKTLVLCISKIISLGSRSTQNKQNSSDAFKEPKTPIEKGDMKTKSDMSFGVIEVTDGWYGIKALLDSPLTALLQKRRLVVGQKIIVHGAELVGSQDPCSPLEAPESLMMKISANSTRPARWYTKLGYHCDPRPFPLPLSSLFGEGGMVGCVDIIVVRTYPIQWMEKSASGMHVFRNERAEEREAHTHYENQQRKLEEVYDKIKTELLDQRRVDKKEKREHKMQRLSEQQIMMLQDGSELYEAVQNSSDPLSIEACLSEQQLKVLNNYRQLLKEHEKMQIEAEFEKALEDAQGDNSCIKRNVSPLWKLCVMDYNCQDSSAVYMLNIWRPFAELHSLLKEGGRYWICYLSATTCKGRHSHVDLQLTVTKKTRYQQLQPCPKVLQRLYHPRKAVTYGMLCDPSFRAICKEVDLAGYVIYILEKAVGPSTIYLADEDQDLVAIKIWASFKQLAVEDIIKPGALVVMSNLKWTTENYAGIPVLLTGELSNFSANPKDGHLREKYIQLKSSVQNLQCFIKDMEKKVETILGRSGAPKLNRDSGDVHTPNQKTLLVPLVSSNVKRKLQTPTTENGSKSMLCSAKITSADSVTELKKKRVNLLSRIPSPVPLPQLSNCISPSVRKDFRPPRSCATPQSAEVVRTSSNNLAQVLSLKKTDIVKTADDNWVTDEELAMIDTQALLEGKVDGHAENDKEKLTGAQISSKDHTLLPKNVKNYLGTQISKMVEDNWVTDEELAMINTQALYEECAHGKDNRKVEKSQVVQMTEFT